QGVAFQIINAVHVTHASAAVVGGAVAVDMTGVCVVHSVARQEIELPEFINAQPPAVQGAGTLVKAADSPVFGPKVGIGRFLPGLGVTPAYLAIVEDLTKPLDGDGRDD